MMNVRLYDTATTKRVIIETSATTYGQLKNSISDANMSVSGKRVCIGELDKELVNDNDQLPNSKLSQEQNVDYTVYLYPQKTKSGK